MENIVEKRRNCSWGAISPLFHNIFNISLTSKVQLPISLLNVVNRIIFSSILQTWYVELRISRSSSESPLEFEITRVDCICKSYSQFFQPKTIKVFAIFQDRNFNMKFWITGSSCLINKVLALDRSSSIRKGLWCTSNWLSAKKGPYYVRTQWKCRSKYAFTSSDQGICYLYSGTDKQDLIRLQNAKEWLYSHFQLEHFVPYKLWLTETKCYILLLLHIG